jgi:hypothetical protein
MERDPSYISRTSIPQIPNGKHNRTRQRAPPSKTFDMQLMKVFTLGALASSALAVPNAEPQPTSTNPKADPVLLVEVCSKYVSTPCHPSYSLFVSACWLFWYMCQSGSQSALRLCGWISSMFEGGVFQGEHELPLLVLRDEGKRWCLAFKARRR